MGYMGILIKYTQSDPSEIYPKPIFYLLEGDCKGLGIRGYLRYLVYARILEGS